MVQDYDCGGRYVARKWGWWRERVHITQNKLWPHFVLNMDALKMAPPVPVA